MLLYSLPGGAAEYILQSWGVPQPAVRQALDLPGAAFGVDTAAVGPDGTCWFAGRRWSGAANQGYCLVVVRRGGSPLVIPTGGFRVAALAVSPQGTRVIACGAEPGREPAAKGELPTVRIFGADGRTHLEAVPRASWPAAKDHWERWDKTRPFAWCRESKAVLFDPELGVLAECDTHSGDVRMRPTRMPEALRGRRTQFREMALLGQGEMVAFVAEQLQGERRLRTSYLRLASGGEHWEPLEVAGTAGFGGLYGSDGNAIILRQGDATYRKFSI
jgi:hypothetical protein